MHPTPPSAPLHKVEQHEDMRREQRGKQPPQQQRRPHLDEAEDGHHIDAYV